MKKYNKATQKMLSIILVVMLFLPIIPLQAIATMSDAVVSEVSEQAGPSEISSEPETEGETPPVDQDAPVGEETPSPAAEETILPADEDTTPPPVDPNESLVDPNASATPTKDIHTLTISYVYGGTAGDELSGTAVAKQYIAELLEDSEYEVPLTCCSWFCPR